ncbi:hypothetical protein QUF80_11085 [Desulfococcaceae bacterium HSG8]|nr:hypothetical protein [Desulfococcaceae bacterium HSG8]
MPIRTERRRAAARQPHAARGGLTNPTHRGFGFANPAGAMIPMQTCRVGEAQRNPPLYHQTIMVGCAGAPPYSY